MAHKNQTIIPPSTGWKDSTWYIVDVKYVPANPVHRSLFYTGFLDKKGNPAGYNGFVPMNGPDREERPASIHEIFYCKAVRELITDDRSVKQQLLEEVCTKLKEVLT